MRAGLPTILIRQTREVSPTDMANDIKEIEYLTKQLEVVMQSVSPQNWDDVADSWFNLEKLSHGECMGSTGTQLTYAPGVEAEEEILHTSSESDLPSQRLLYLVFTNSKYLCFAFSFRHSLKIGTAM